MSVNISSLQDHTNMMRGQSLRDGTGTDGSNQQSAVTQDLKCYKRAILGILLPIQTQTDGQHSARIRLYWKF
jgi:hypothetical protein